MYHRTCGKGCCNSCWHHVFKCCHAFFLKGPEPTQDGPANDARSQDLILVHVRAANPMEHEDRRKEPEDGNDENDGRRVD